MTPMNPFPVFWARCGVCDSHESSLSLTPYEPQPFTYLCWRCSLPEHWYAQQRHNVEEFKRLTPEQQHNVRFTVLGADKTREIENRAKLREARR